MYTINPKATLNMPTMEIKWNNAKNSIFVQRRQRKEAKGKNRLD